MIQIIEISRNISNTLNISEDEILSVTSTIIMGDPNNAHLSWFLFIESRRLMISNRIRCLYSEGASIEYRHKRLEIIGLSGEKALNRFNLSGTWRN